MNNFFLLNEAISLDDFGDFKLGMSELVAIERDQLDVFIKHDSIWEIPITGQLFSNFGQEEQVITEFIVKMQTFDIYLKDEEVFDLTFKGAFNAYLGIDFSNTSISEQRKVTNNYTYLKVKDKDLWNDLSFRNLWKKKELLFPNLILCGVVHEQLSKIGNSSFFNQIVEKLKELDKVSAKWLAGEFNYRMVNRDYALVVSPESEITMENYSNQRVFALPNGERKTFELHIKAGDLRFHFFPDNETKSIYVGYIGPHLSTHLHK